MNIKLTEFAKRHFKKDFKGTKINIDKDEFVSRLNSSNHELLDGYADFCKLLIVPNFTDSKSGTLLITDDNIKFLKSGYSSRREGELPVLCRWFDISQDILPISDYLCIILYNREQLYKEFIETNIGEFEFSEDVEWGIVAILAQNSSVEEPMKPETMLRNYMPLEFGGSGMSYPIKSEFELVYKKCVEFWDKNANVL